MNRAPRHLRITATIICGYEIVALWTDLPTITHIGRRYPLAAKMMNAWVDNHFSIIEAMS